MKFDGRDLMIVQPEERDAAGQKILCRKDRGNVSILNSTASEIWTYLNKLENAEADLTSEILAKHIETRFDVSGLTHKEIVDDVDACIGELVSAGLIEIVAM